jgi:hypothetical protein
LAQSAIESWLSAVLAKSFYQVLSGDLAGPSPNDYGRASAAVVDLAM